MVFFPLRGGVGRKGIRGSPPIAVGVVLDTATAAKDSAVFLKELQQPARLSFGESRSFSDSRDGLRFVGQHSPHARDLRLTIHIGDGTEQSVFVGVVVQDDFRWGLAVAPEGP